MSVWLHSSSKLAYVDLHFLFLFFWSKQKCAWRLARNRNETSAREWKIRVEDTRYKNFSFFILKKKKIFPHSYIFLPLDSLLFSTVTTLWMHNVHIHRPLASLSLASINIIYMIKHEKYIKLTSTTMTLIFLFLFFFLSREIDCWPRERFTLCLSLLDSAH